MIRKAKDIDIKYIEEIYSKIHTEEEQGRMTIGWKRGVYPTRDTAEQALVRNDLFVNVANDKIVATAIINQIQVPEYADCPWQYEVDDSRIMVLHTLIVDPEESGHGYAREFVEFYTQYALENECHYLRMDTQEKNLAARAMYKKMRFTEPAIVDCSFNGIDGVKLVCLEKKI